jgi:Ser/Thr protein kinase RdoA (MazF antagonist)
MDGVCRATMPSMQQGWERRYPFLELGREALGRLLRRGFPGARVLEAEPLTAGLRNTNYRVRLLGRAEPVVVRLYTADPAACRREVALTTLVRSSVPVPEVLYADPRADPPLAVLRWIEGVKLDDLLRSGDAADVQAAAFAAGTVLARIHTYQFGGSGFLGPDLRVARPLNIGTGWAGYIDGFLGRGQAGARLGADLSRRLSRMAAANAGCVLRLRDDRSLVHADFKPWNLLVRRAAGTWTVAGVLDWEFAFAGPPLVDLAIFLRHEASLPPEYARGFVAGYSLAGGHLPTDWRWVAKLLDLLNLCSMLDQPGGDGAFVEEIRALVRATVGAWEGA